MSEHVVKDAEAEILAAGFIAYGPGRYRRPDWPVSWRYQEYADGSLRREAEPVTVDVEGALRIVRAERAAEDRRLLNELAVGLLARGCELPHLLDTARSAFHRLHGRWPLGFPEEGPR